MSIFHTPSAADVDTFASAYIACAAWVGETSPDQLAPADAEILDTEAREFLEDPHAWRLIECATYRTRGRYTWESAGHDFYLTRERHGAGFWDRGLGAVGDALTKLSHPYGSSDYIPQSLED